MGFEYLTNVPLAKAKEDYIDLMLRSGLQDALGAVYDIERLCSKIVYGSLNARDCTALLQTLLRIPMLKSQLDGCNAEALVKIQQELDAMEDIAQLLSAAIIENPPISIREGNIIRTGYHAEVDELRSIKENSERWLSDFTAAERERTGIKNLKVGFNRVFGYYIEITKSNYSQIPYHYERKQTLANAERFITPELKEMEQRIHALEQMLKEVQEK